jgi:hypothetical protein
MGIISHIVISEVERAHRAKVKRTQAAVDRAVRDMLTRDPRPLWPTAEELARQQRGRNRR